MGGERDKRVVIYNIDSPILFTVLRNHVVQLQRGLAASQFEPVHSSRGSLSLVLCSLQRSKLVQLIHRIRTQENTRLMSINVKKKN